MDILELDIETAPNSVFTWGLFNQNIGINQIIKPGYTLCWAACWNNNNKILYKSIHEHGHDIMVKTIWELLDQADAVIHYNGAHFDIPILNKDFVQMGLGPPTPYHQIDLLQVVRRRFNLTSNKLDFVASHFLGCGNKLQHKGFELWDECMQGVDKSWKMMKRYNIQDVKLLRQVYDKLLPWIQDHPNQSLYTEDEVEMCTNCGSQDIVKKGWEHLKTQSYQRYKCNSCGTPLRGRSTILSIDKRKTILTSSKL